jgi:hypothetical protein
MTVARLSYHTTPTREDWLAGRRVPQLLEELLPRDS